MGTTDNSMLLNSRRKFKRFDSSLFVEVRPLEGVASYFLGLTRDISCEGLSFTFQNFAIEPGQRLQFKLKQPRTNVMISFLGDVIWQKQNDIKYSAGVKFYDVKKKNKKILLKVISDCCNIPVNSLLNNKDTGELLNYKRVAHAGSTSDIINNNELISGIPNRNSGKFRWLYGTALVLAVTAAVLFLPAVMKNFEDVSGKPVTESSKSMAMYNSNKVKDLFNYLNGQKRSRDIQTVNSSVQSQTAENGNSEENITSAIKKREPDIKLPANKNNLRNNQYASPVIYTIQTGSHTKKASAEKEFNSIQQALNKKEHDFLRIEKIGKFYAVRLGKFDNYNNTEKFYKAIKPRLSTALILKTYYINNRIIMLYEYN